MTVTRAILPIVAIIAGFHIAGCRAETASAQSQLTAAEQPSPDRVGTLVPEVDRLCRFDAVQLSPRGTFAVFSPSYDVGHSFKSMDELVIADVDCVLNSVTFGGCLFDAYAIGGARALAWSSSEKSLFLIEASKNLLRLDVQSGRKPLGIVRERDPVPRDIGETAIYVGPTPSEANAPELQRLSNALSAYQPKRELTLLGLHMDRTGLVGTTAEERPSLRLMASALRTGPAWTGLLTPFAEDWSIAPDASGRPEFSSLGYRASSSVTGWKAEGVAPYQSMLTDPETGVVVGSRTERTMEAYGRQGLPESLSPSSYIRSVSATKPGAGASAATITANIFGVKTYEIRRGPKAVRFDCKGYLTAPAGFGVTYLELGDAARKLPARLYTTGDRSKADQRLVVFFHGGPAQTLANGANHVSVLRYLQLGYDVLAVEYSGSRGGGAELARRLSETGGAALQEDAKKVRTFVLSQYPDRKVIVHGESFGALPAIRTEQALGIAVDTTVLVAPYVRHRSAYRLASDRSYNQAYQADFELATMGIRDQALASELDLIREYPRRSATGWMPKSRVLAVFAENDRSVLPGDLDGVSGIDRKIVSKVGHQTILVQPETWDTIQAALGDGQVSGLALSADKR